VRRSVRHRCWVPYVAGAAWQLSPECGLQIRGAASWLLQNQTVTGLAVALRRSALSGRRALGAGAPAEWHLLPMLLLLLLPLPLPLLPLLLLPLPLLWVEKGRGWTGGADLDGQHAGMLVGGGGQQQGTAAQNCACAEQHCPACTWIWGGFGGAVPGGCSLWAHVANQQEQERRGGDTAGAVALPAAKRGLAEAAPAARSLQLARRWSQVAAERGWRPSRTLLLLLLPAAAAAAAALSGAPACWCCCWCLCRGAGAALDPPEVGAANGVHADAGATLALLC
jgi:hypothetical protein